jgi:hypothetical protein
LEGDSSTADMGDSRKSVGASNAMVASLASSCSGGSSHEIQRKASP